jgi:purine catabolism regulator
VADKVRGYLAITRKVTAEDRFAKMCLDQALMVLALEFSMKDSVKRIREQAREEFFIQLLAGTLAMEDIAQYRAKQIGFPTGKPQYILALQAGKNEAGKMALQELKKNHPSISMAGHVGDLVVAACSTSQTDLVSQRNEAVELANSICEQIQNRHNLQIVMGIGYPRERLSNLHESYAEAKKALDTGQKVSGFGRVIHYSDIYVEEMLLDLVDHPALNALYQIYLSPVQTYDQKNGTDLLQTLELYVRFGGNTKKVANQLFIHRNSVNYRLERIKEILGTDLNDPETRLKLDLAVRAWKLKVIGS